MSSRNSTPIKGGNSNGDITPNRFATMQRLQRMKTQYQLLQKLQDDFAMTDSDDETSNSDQKHISDDIGVTGDHDDKFRTLNKNASTGHIGVGGKTARKQSVWHNVRKTVLTTSNASSSMSLAVEAAKKAKEKESRRKSTTDSSLGKMDEDDDAPSPRTRTGGGGRRKIHHEPAKTSKATNKEEISINRQNSLLDDDDGTTTLSVKTGYLENKTVNEDNTPPIAPEEEDATLDAYWKDFKLEFPEDKPLDTFNLPTPPNASNELHVQASEQGIVIGRIPKATVQEQKDVLKERLWSERDRAMKAMKKKEEDLLWREVLAKKRVEVHENEAANRIAAEKMKVEESKLERERLLSREFRRARESLEASTRHQNAKMGEVFGTLDSRAHETLSRKMYIKSTELPQPVEFRIRMLRAVKTKLPKGAYLLMLTQYESLGGRPLAWTEIGTYGIGEEFPGTTKAVKHSGRYFDRTMKFEDSCYALCPPLGSMKPGFCFVLELFQLSSRTNREDRPVGWAALPMCNEEMSVVEGKFRIPMLRGQHSPMVSGYWQMEKAISEDLDNWLCNIYFDVRKFSLTEMNGVVANSDYYQKSVKGNPISQREALRQRTQIKDIVKLNRYINLDFINKRLSLQNGQGKYSRTFGQKEKEDDEMLSIDTDTLFHRPRYEGDDNKKRQRHFAKATDTLTDKSFEDEEARRKLLSGGAMGRSFNHYEDGFALSTKDDKWSHDNRQLNIQGPIRKLFGEAKAWLTGSVYVPSEGDAWRETRRYKNPHVKDQAELLNDGHSESSKAIPHFGRQDTLKGTKTPAGSSLIDEVSDGIDLESGTSSKKFPISDNDTLPREIEETQIKKEKRAHRKMQKRAMKQAVRAAIVGGNTHISLQDGHENSVFTADVPSGDVVKHSVKFIHPVTGEVKLAIPGNDDDLDSDGFSDDSDSSIDSDLDALQDITNDENYFNTEAGMDSRADTTVLERGLETETSGVAKGLHPEQSGKIVGVETVESAHSRFYASSGLEKRVIRRLQSDGLRLDSEVIDNNEKDKSRDSSLNTASLPSFKGIDVIAKMNTKISSKDIHKLWKPLDNRKDVEMYDMALASDISKRAHLLPGALAASKIRFLLLEAFGDLMGHKMFSFDFFATISTLIFAFWLRIYVHFLAQYLYLGIIEVPVYGFEMQPFQIKYKYMNTGMLQVHEIALICIGPASNIIVFLLFMLAGRGFTVLAGNLPDGLSNFLSAYGIMTFLDSFLILIVDLIKNNYNCSNSSDACIADYTQAACTCFTGDWMKLWDRLQYSEGGGGGLTGVLITIIIYISFSIVAAFVYYIYLIYIHRNGRILDLWRRTHSLAQEFFVPDDYELSSEELVHICTKAGMWRGGGGDIRRVSVTKLIEKDANDENFLNITKLYAIHEMAMDGNNKKLYRQFLLMPNGCILEVFSDFKINDKFIPTTEKEKQLLLMENWNSGGADLTLTGPPKVDTFTSAQRTKKGLFRGLEKA